ncbi:Afadin and alpha-actinin-binding-domain-containing protein [Desarmillaria tabescens]|uniref:Afadin and alpha-actinin-binding-domain-containing protein n=1 Tax=Armillaria tabescens TaxID=1929756 RepID=A0AA39NJJ6_ARMTA|nr:Afadin and alpha-actinin-binding-domain-containing protein [Desarmillaria tabescens]KAK0466831.1 Afadin and alpha-actinin-binding-domain-containing protein [Desarmillaria tabescens]
MTTPAKKLVHWDVASPNFSEFGSPASNASSESLVSTSSLQYINAQLAAHGFAPPQGLSLEGISNANMDSAVKCLTELLGQRVKDMSRAEELATELRTLRYDHERMKSMHSSAAEKAANFEREMNVHKSRLNTTTKTLQSTEQSHRQTTAELQRSRTVLQAVRATHQAELKKKEKEFEKMAEKWNKISDAQAKVMAASSGFACSNLRIVNGGSDELVGRGPGVLEVALQEAEKARSQFATECSGLKTVILNAVNGLQRLIYDTKGSDSEPDPTPFTMATLFPFAAPEVAGDKLASVLLSFHESLRVLAVPTTPVALPTDNSALADEERERLQAVIDSLKTELELAQQNASSRTTETQVLFDRFATDERLATGHDPADVSVDFMTVPERDKHRERLDDIKKQLEEERKKFTEATINLGKERASLEMERKKLNDEKRSWQVEMMLADLPPTPIPSGQPSEATSPRKSPRKSPAKGNSGAARKTTRVRRRSSLTASPTKKKVEPAFETEVIVPSTSRIISDVKGLESSPSLLPNSFVLPPPSPHSVLPSQPSLFLSQLAAAPPVPVPTSSALPDNKSYLLHRRSCRLHPILNPYLHQCLVHLNRVFVDQFPMAKPFAPRMIHAYSPVRPSPLSRILQLGNSPTSPNGLNFDDSSSSSGLEVLPEEDEEVAVQTPQEPVMTLAQELGVPDSPPEPERAPSPLGHKQVPSNTIDRGRTNQKANVSMTKKGRIIQPEPKRLTAQEKGKGKADGVGPGVGSKGKLGMGEKENNAIKRAPTRKEPSVINFEASGS